MKSKRWKRRNRHIRPEWVEAEFEYIEYPSFHPYRIHPHTGLILYMDLRTIAYKLWRSNTSPQHRQTPLVTET